MLPLFPPALAEEPSKLVPDHTAGIQNFLGIPYVEDGVLDERNRWVSFTHPDTPLARPGLNCSGFVVAAARQLLGCRLGLAQITRDRLGDSGEGAALGKDWDFGWDLILNLSDGRGRRWILPEGAMPVGPKDGRSVQGFPIQDEKAWARVLPLMKKDCIYLASLSRNEGHGIRHHHVALLLRDALNRTWFYQTLPAGHSHRLELSAPRGFERLCAMFGPGEWILILEVESKLR